jgi:hypothetical protein
MERVAWLDERIHALEEGLQVEPVSVNEQPHTNGHPYIERRERVAADEMVRRQIAELQEQRLIALRGAWANWHETRGELHRRIRMYDGLAALAREQLQALYANKPPLLPAPERKRQNREVEMVKR